MKHLMKCSMRKASGLLDSHQFLTALPGLTQNCRVSGDVFITLSCLTVKRNPFPGKVLGRAGSPETTSACEELLLGKDPPALW